MVGAVSGPAPDATRPAHYRQGAIEPWDFILSQGLGFLAGNIVKYIARYRHKNGLEDLLKARTYLDKLIAAERAREATPGDPT